MQSLVEENWSTELFWFPLNGMCSARVLISAASMHAPVPWHVGFAAGLVPALQHF